MKKIFSTVLALAMTLSLFTITANAGTNGYFDVSYEAINVASGDVTNLAVGDTFYAVLTLKEAEGILVLGAGLNWDSSVITPVDSNGEASTALGKILSNRADSTLKKYDDTEGDDIPAFSRAGDTSFAADSFYYEIATATAFAGQDYELSGDTTILKLRLKVVGEGAANITAGKTKLQETKADGVVRYPELKVSSFTIGSEDVTVEATIAPVDDPNAKGALEPKEDGKNYYTQGFKATLTPGTETVKSVIAEFLNNGNKGKVNATWTTEAGFSGETPITFAVNVLNVPEIETVTAEWSIVK